jgi:hypothetical protein
MSGQSLILTVNHSFNIVFTVSITYQTLRDYTKYFDIKGLMPLMVCTAEMTYEHARLCIAITFKIEYWLLPKLAKGIRELYMIVSIP